MNHIDVLDQGYVRLVQHVGSDLTVVNSARASFERESKELNDKDRNLIDFLLSNDHTSVLRHCFVTYEVRAPLMVARQHFKYQIGSNFGEYTSGWNESSRRYINDRTEFYKPEVWRKAPANAKQGSGGDLGDAKNLVLTKKLERIIAACREAYDWAIYQGVAPEQARLFLPAYGLYIRYYWSASLQTVLHFLTERLASDAQEEIRWYAAAVRDLTAPLFPEVFKATGLSE